ncbi:MAG: glycosyltransferase family 4 protein [Thermoplasmatales archaeon]|nr:glycosyltransferase family 4 protein [Thermoplasmatales archaeon]
MIVKYAEALSAKGHSVVIYVPILPPMIQKYGYSIYSLYRLCRGSVKRAIDILSNRAEDKKSFFVTIPVISNCFVRNADATFATAWPTAYCVNSLSASKGHKFYFVQGYEKWDLNRFPNALRRLDYSYKLPLVKICVSKWLVDELYAKFSVQSDVVWNWIDDIFYFNGQKDYEESGMRVLCVGNKSTHKGTATAIEAYEIVKSKYPDTKLVIFANDKIKELPLGVGFYLNPPSGKIVELYRKSHILVSPSMIEGFGLPILEGMASRCAVISTPVGMAYDIGKDNENILFFEPGDVEKLSKNIIRLIENRKDLKAMAVKGQAESRRFSKDLSLSKMECLILKKTQYKEKSI